MALNANNYLANSAHYATTEAIALVTKFSVNLEQFHELARTSSAINRAMLENHRWFAWRNHKLENGPDDHARAMIHKDLKRAVDVAKEVDLNLTYLESMLDMDVRSLLKSYQFAGRYVN
jgi:3-hydroxyisobutyrate dehydrogenase-like beta-hydroxyacid dehydrogenase